MTNPNPADIRWTSNLECELRQSAGGDDDVCEAARVSTDTHELGKNIDLLANEKLIGYLMREKHGSPFEHNFMKFYVSAPIFVFREFQRHRIGFSYNEVSGRYSKMEGKFYLPPTHRKIFNGGTSAKPAMVEREDSDEARRLIYFSTRTANIASWNSYCAMLEVGVANEVARGVLPVNLYSQMYVSMNLRSALSFLSLRTQRKDALHISRPQWEIEQLALKIEDAVQRLFPISYKAYNDNRRVAP